jgi:hypothetical protein
MLLQVSPTAGVFDVLVQYGVLGIATLGLGWACWKLLQRQLDAETRLNEKIDELDVRFNKYVDEDHGKLKETVETNTKAYLELRDMIVITHKK